MELTRKKLSMKGWSKEEIDKTIKILRKAKRRKHPLIDLLDNTVYWIAFVLIIIGNFAFSTFLIPVLVTFNNLSLYLVVLLLAASFGILMSVVVKDIEGLQKGHHLAMLLIVPIVGIVNFFVVVTMANNNPLADLLQTYHSPIIVGLVYLIGFMVPYTYLVFEKWIV